MRIGGGGVGEGGGDGGRPHFSDSITAGAQDTFS